jgi:sugar lactone lactonase YvrE
MSASTIARPLDLALTSELRFLPEGPFPLGDGRFSWVGIQHGVQAKVGSVNIADLSQSKSDSFELPGRPGFALPTTDEGVFVVGCERSLGYFNIQDRSWKTFVDSVDADVDNTIINDGMIYRDNLIFGTKDLAFKEKKAGLYLYRGRDRKLIRLRADQLCSNGKAVLDGDNDHVRFIDIDSPTRKIVQYELDIAAGKLSSPKTIVDFAGDPAVPDGQILTPDRKGLIVSMFRPEAAEQGETRWYELATGKLKHTWITPGSPQNTCPNLVRNQGKIHLIITTAVEHMSASDQAKCSTAGQLFLAETPFENLGAEAADRFPVLS